MPSAGLGPANQSAGVRPTTSPRHRGLRRAFVCAALGALLVGVGFLWFVEGCRLPSRGRHTGPMGSWC